MVAFDTDASMSGEMTVTYRLEDVGGATELTGVHEILPPGVRPEDDELGWTISIGELAALVAADV